MVGQLSAVRIRLMLAVVWLGILFSVSDPLGLIQEYGGFAFLGVVGAIFANSTGAGGGVVFMPFFSQLQFSPMTAISTSFAIQCCGMTAGALTWWAFYRKLRAVNGALVNQWQAITPVLAFSVPFSLIGVWLVQYNPVIFNLVSGHDELDLSFGIFSILLSLAILATLPLMQNLHFTLHLNRLDKVCLATIALGGGAITAWLSVGVGELIAVYLIMRRFNVTFAIACAVILSAFTVWGGIVYHLLVSQAVYWPVVFFAGAGAIIGGILAKRLVLFFSARNLKLFFAGWIMIMGLSTLPF